MLIRHWLRGGLSAVAITLCFGLAATMVGCGSDDDSADNGTTFGRSCRSNGDCPGDEPYCSGGRCVECLSDANCGDPAQLCDAVAGECLDSCASTAECDGDRMCSETRGACVNCLDDNDCTDAGKPFCVPELDECAECRSSADCGGGPCESGHCRECDSNVDCPSAEPFCDVADNKCRECLQNDHCAPGETCDGKECKATCNLDPSSCGPDKVCHADSGACVQCLTDEHCLADKPGCIDFECRECSNDEHCDVGKTCNLDEGKCQ